MPPLSVEAGLYLQAPTGRAERWCVASDPCHLDCSYYGCLNRFMCTIPAPCAACRSILRQVLAGLAHIHAQGIIHRDLKVSWGLGMEDAQG